MWRNDSSSTASIALAASRSLRRVTRWRNQRSAARSTDGHSWTLIRVPTGQRKSLDLDGIRRSSGARRSATMLTTLSAFSTVPLISMAALVRATVR